MDDTLLLSEGMAQNYIALQNFFNGVCTEQRRSQRGGAYSKGPKRKARKVQRIHNQGGRCIDCHEPFPFDGERYDLATADHVIPYRFGATLDHNCEFVCGPCNQKRELNREEIILKYFGSIT